MKKVKIKQKTLIDNLLKNGFQVKELSKSPLLFNVNGKLVNVKTKLTFNDKKHGKEFWFGVYKSVLNKTEYTLIQMVDNNSFLFFTSKFLLENWSSFYTANKSETFRTFMIEWDSSNLVSNKRIDIDNFYCNIEDNEGLIFKI